MKNIEDLSYKELQSECARLGIGGKGTTSELSNRLDRFLKGDEQQKIFVGEDDNADVSPDEVIANPDKPQDQILANNELDEAKLRHEADWDSLKAKLDIIFVGRVQYFLQENSTNNYSVVFKGTLRRSECINLTAGHKTITSIAAKYVGRGELASKTGGDTPSQAMTKFEARMNT